MQQTNKSTQGGEVGSQRQVCIKNNWSPSTSILVSQRNPLATPYSSNEVAKLLR